MSTLKGRNLISITDFSKEEYIEVLDITTQNPDLKVAQLLGSDQFTYAQNAVEEEETSEEFAEFEL